MFIFHWPETLQLVAIVCDDGKGRPFFFSFLFREQTRLKKAERGCTTRDLTSIQTRHKPCGAPIFTTDQQAEASPAVNSRGECQTIRAFILAYSMSLLQKVKNVIGSPMVGARLRKRLWVYRPGHARVKGNDRVGTLVDKTAIIRGLRLGRST